jgi:hypothetical protein
MAQGSSTDIGAFVIPGEVEESLNLISSRKQMSGLRSTDKSGVAAMLAVLALPADVC